MDYYQTLKNSIEKIICDANQTEYYGKRVMSASEFMKKIEEVIGKIDFQKRIDEGEVKLYRAKLPEYNIDITIDEIEYEKIRDGGYLSDHFKRIETDDGLIFDIPLYKFEVVNGRHKQETD